MKLTGSLAWLAGGGLGAALLVRAVQKQREIRFTGQTVVITGGSRGLGLVLARELAEESAQLVLLARNQQELDRAAEDLRGRGAQVLTIPCDVREQTEVNSALQQAREHYGSLDVLINNAGVIQAGPVEHMTHKDFENAMAVHFYGPLYTMLAAIPMMREQGGGRIVNISSIGGKIAVPHLAPYSASKFALVGLSDALRAELAKDNIRITTVCPGLMRTGSHVNAQFKGQHEAEFFWFSLLDALPLTSMAAPRAARQIIAACRRGSPQLTITIQAKLAVAVNALFPSLTAELLALSTSFLPGPTTAATGDQLKSGWESRSNWAPSVLTHLADQAIRENNEEPDSLSNT